MTLISSDFVPKLARKTDSKIVLLVIDGLGGLPGDDGKTELEAAKTPNLDELVKKSVTGMSVPIASGITPGSGPGHFALFGYDPVTNDIGRGALAALGIGFDLKVGDVAARINFATIDDSGNITDRRAGRISTEECTRLTAMLDEKISIDGVETFIRPVKDHRAVVIFRGDGISENVGDTDPQATGVPPLQATATDSDGEKMAGIARDLVVQAREILKDENPANMILLRGFAEYPDLTPFAEAYKLTPAAIATYPDYKGMARVVGMDVIETGMEIADEIATLKESWDKYDFFFFHVKKTDSYGEDGNREGKIHVIEELDSLLPKIMALGPDVVVVTGDHSTPTQMKAHSFHPVPLMVAADTVRPDHIQEFGETACAQGALGNFSAPEIMAFAMALAGKLAKYGA
jgi:2,3-bisphosphoglycerate-independent phosphoglycerate mutase